MNFGQAVEALKQGDRVSRAGWNGKNMWLWLNTFINCDPCIVMHTAQDTHQPGWLASQADILANDWEIV